MPNLPSGTATFLFSDIEGSTRLNARLGDGRFADEVLAVHRRLVRETFAQHEGAEMGTEGDAFYYAFPRARGAVAAAIAVQRAHEQEAWVDGLTVRIRIGLHTGEPVVGDEGYTGLDIVRAARIAAIALGGQVLLSETTRALVGNDLPADIELRSLGERLLKDFDRPEPVYELRIPDVSVTASGALVSASPAEIAPPAADVPAIPPIPPSALTGLDAFIPADAPAWVRGLTRRASTLGDRTRQTIEERLLAELAADPELAAALPDGVAALFRQRAGRSDRPARSIPDAATRGAARRDARQASLRAGVPPGPTSERGARRAAPERDARGRSRSLPSPGPSMTEELARLRDLHEAGALTDEQYAKAVDRAIEGG